MNSADELKHNAILFETATEPSERNKTGKFYTPLPIVRKMVSDLLAPLRAKLEKGERPEVSILDPACGSGIFLLEAIDYLSEFEEGPAKITLRCWLVEKVLYGVDLDPAAVEKCRELVMQAVTYTRQLNLLTETSIPKLNIHCGNTLLEPGHFSAHEKNIQALTPFCFATEFPEIKEQGGFDFVIGNPPYGLSRGSQMTPEENRKLKQVYSETRSGKANKYLLFLARSYDLLAPNGRLVLIVPNAWLGIKAGFSLRKKLLREGAIQSLDIFQCQVFRDISVETVIVSIQKSNPSSSIRISHHHCLENLHSRETFKLKTKDCAEDKEFRIPIIGTKETFSLVSYLRKTGVALSSNDSGFEASIALQAYTEGGGQPPQSAHDVRNHIFHFKEKIDEYCFPYFEGSDVSRYRTRWSGQYLRYGPWLAEPQTIEKFSGPRVVVREILGPKAFVLQAALMSDINLYNKSVLHIRPKKDPDSESLLALVALLNSQIASFFIMQAGRKSQRRIFPKIVKEDLDEFPLPKNFSKVAGELATRAQKISDKIAMLQPQLAAKIWRQSADNPDLEVNEILTLQSELDDRIFEIYELKNSHVEILRKFLS